MKNYRRIITVFLFSTLLHFTSFSQQFGNEWIDYSKTYYKIKVASDGIYRINQSTLLDAGVPVQDIKGSDFKLHAYGEEYPIYLSSANTMDEDDYIEFYGYKNRGQLDEILYEVPQLMQLNPDYSLFNDTMVYFLSWEDESINLRTQNYENDLSGSLPSPEAYYVAEEKITFSDEYYKPAKPQKIYSSNFELGEGFGSESNVNHEYELNIDHIYDNGVDPSIQIRASSNNVPHETEIIINDNILENRKYSLITLQNFEYSFPISTLEESNTILIQGKDSNSDRTTIATISLDYPREFVSNNNKEFHFSLDANNSATYLEIDIPDMLDGIYYLYDTNSNTRMKLDNNSDNQLKVLLPQTSSSKDIHIFHESLIEQNTSLKSRSFVNKDTINAEYLVLSSTKLRSDNMGNDWVQEYADFRSSMDGGSYTTYVINVEDLYDEYSYGIGNHVLGIKNMSRYFNQSWADFKFAFIIGKAVDLRYIRTAESMAENGQHFVLPSYGSISPSDNLLFSEFGKTIPDVAVGRIAASTPEQVKIYLDKAIDHSAVINNVSFEGNQLWTKDIIHLGGGGGANQKENIKNKLNEMAMGIEKSKFGANVTSYFKTTSENVQELPSEQIISNINQGTSIITFFGHSAVGTLDYSLEQAYKYDNKGKYPMFVSLGCLSGNIHTPQNIGVSEDFVLTKDKGSIVFLASSGTAQLEVLYVLAVDLYKKLGEDLYGKTLGEINNKSLNILNGSSSLNYTSLVEQQTFHGDPAIRLYPKETPDYETDYSSIKTDPEIINAASDKFDVSFDIANLGSTVDDSISVKIIHLNASKDTISILRKNINTPYYSENYSFTIPLDNKNTLGENTILVYLDNEDKIQEYPFPIAETNNILINNNGEEGYKFYIIDNNMIPISPKDFGIVSDPNTPLMASSSNLFLDEQTYIIEIDTTELFTTVIDRKEIIQSGGLLSWLPNINYEDEKVYYWRVSPDSTDSDLGYVWRGNSFIYLEGEDDNGWNQSDYFQFEKDKFTSLALMDTTNGLNFSKNFIELRIVNAAIDGEVLPQFFLNGAKSSSALHPYSSPTICFVVFDTDGKIWRNVNEDWTDPLYDSFNPYTKWGGYGFYYYPSKPEDRIAAINFIENVVPDDHLVVMNTILKNKNVNFRVEEWAADSINNNGKNLFNVLEDVGAKHIRSMESSGVIPYTYIFKKGEGSIVESIADDIHGTAYTNYAVKGIWYEGNIVSKDIGPAQSWDRILWEESYSEMQEHDTTSISVIGINANTNKVDTLINEEQSYDIDISSIDAAKYPHIRLVYHTKDDRDYTTAQLDHWRVVYEQVPELVLYTDSESYFHADSIYQGDVLRSSLKTRNITDIPMDSLLVKYTITDDKNTEVIKYETLGKIEANGSMNINNEFLTRPMTSDFTYRVEVNPNEAQKEQYQFNNLAYKKVHLLKDEENPLLKVMFDGIQIIDYDIVSPTPLIRIQLKDNSPFMLTDDVNLFKLELKSPDGTRESIDLNSDIITFYPSQDENEAAYIEYKPELTQEGDYNLNVEAEDASGNLSGDNSYDINFKVILAQKITKIINYPNPFSTKTQFIFTLTGNELPQFFKIQIMSASGKVVKEITEAELGSIHIGLNRTEYQWDGTDDYGEKLANGVYFYKAIIKNANGESYDEIETSIDQFFKENWGKLVIIR